MKGYNATEWNANNKKADATTPQGVGVGLKKKIPEAKEFHALV